MATPTESERHVTRDRCLVFSERQYIDVKTPEKMFQVCEPCFAEFHARDDATLHQCRRPDGKSIGIAHCTEIARRIGLTAKNRNDCRGIEYHVGSPWSS
jgi:hypothetical protein